MKIIYIVPGSGGTFYCQNCMRDNAMIRALRRLGHDVIMVPMYLPFQVDAADSADVPVFFGGINVYLQEKFKVFRKTPRWIDKLFDSSWMLNQAAAREGSTEAAGLGPMTLSMLLGKDGNQQKELDRLIDWLLNVEKPDLVHISNSLLSGLAAEIKCMLKIPVVCTLQDEEGWLDSIDSPYDQMCWEAMSKCAADIDIYVSVSKWYADRMCDRMALPPERIKVVPLGIELENRNPSKLPFNPPVIGYLSKMSESLGLGLLVDAFIELKQNPPLRDLKLKATGGLIGDDIKFVEKLKKRLAKHGMESDASFLDDFSEANRLNFLESLTVLSVPVEKGEAFGLYILESLAAGVPVVQPNVAAFPEVIEATGGGIVYDVEKQGALAKALESLLLNPERISELGDKGRATVFERFGIDIIAQEMTNVYHKLM